MFQSISSRSLTRADENGSGNIEIGLGYRRRGRVSLSLGSYKTDNKQLLDEVEHDSDNYQGQSLSYLPKPKAEADNTN